MRNLLLQYPSLVEPLLPIAEVAIPTIDGWGQPTNEPLRFPQKLTLENYKAEILEPTLFIIPEIDSWFRPASQPVYPRNPLISEGFSVGILEPTLFIVPDFDWVQPTNEPILPKQQPLLFSFDFPWEEILPAPVAHNFPDWFVLTETPIQLGKSFPGYSVEPLEPTLYIEPDFNSWFRPANEPVLPLKPLVNVGQSLAILNESLFIAVIIVLPPFCIDAQQTYIAGAVTGEGYTAGAIKIQQYGAGPKTQDGDC